jgi:hypothetical protein
VFGLVYSSLVYLMMLVTTSGCTVSNVIMNMHDFGWMRMKAVLLKGSEANTKFLSQDGFAWG